MHMSAVVCRKPCFIGGLPSPLALIIFPPLLPQRSLNPEARNLMDTSHSGLSVFQGLVLSHSAVSLCFRRCHYWIYILFKVLEHIHNSYFKVLVSCMSYIIYFRAYCSSVPGFLWKGYYGEVADYYWLCLYAVSYKHLTLPTILRV